MAFSVQSNRRRGSQRFPDWRLVVQLTLLSDDKELLDETNVVRVAVEGKISQDDMDSAKDPMRLLLGPLIFNRKLLLNLEKATYINSSGVSWLIICHKHFVMSKGQLILHSVPPLVDQVLQLMRIPSIMPVVADEAAARAVAREEKQ
jgi:anti-anti-sigma factor